jgi:sulfur relay protein TusB/DsrH
MSKFVSAEDQVSIFKLAGELAAKGEDVVFLHIQEACKATASAEYCSMLLEARVKIYALRADAEARMLTKKMHPSVELIDYMQWVSLLMDKHDKIVSWTS